MAQEIKRDHFGFGPPRFKAEVYAPITSFAVLIRACIRATFSFLSVGQGGGDGGEEKPKVWTIRGSKWIEGEERLRMDLGNYKPREDYGLDSGTNIDSTSPCSQGSQVRKS